MSFFFGLFCCQELLVLLLLLLMRDLKLVAAKLFLQLLNLTESSGPGCLNIRWDLSLGGRRSL